MIESQVFLLEKLVDIFINRKEMKSSRGAGLQAMGNFLKTIFTSSSSHLKDQIDNFYRVFIQTEPTTDDEAAAYDDQKVNGKIVNFWCFSPAFG